jgi:hypothetical protein
MKRELSTGEKPSLRKVRGPVVVAAAIAVTGVLAMAVVDHGPWSRPQTEAADIAIHTTTGESARAAGATVTPTARKSEVEPVAPGPKRAQTVNPVTP